MAGPIALLFATAGLALIFSAFLGQNVTLAGATIPSPKTPPSRAVGGLFGSGLVVAALVIGGVINPGPGPTPTPTPLPTLPASTESIPPTPIPVPTPTGQITTTGCVITISNPLVSMYEKPDMFSLEVGRVPVGDYSPTQTTVVEFAGKQQRWFQITVAAKSGWVLDDTILIATKSADCP